MKGNFKHVTEVNKNVFNVLNTTAGLSSELFYCPNIIIQILSEFTICIRIM